MRKKVFFTVSIISCLFMFFFGGLPDAEGQTGEFPSVSIPEDRYDFGTMGEGITVSHDFVFKNLGTAVLSLEPIQLS